MYWAAMSKRGENQAFLTRNNTAAYLWSAYVRNGPVLGGAHPSGSIAPLGTRKLRPPPVHVHASMRSSRRSFACCLCAPPPWTVRASVRSRSNRSLHPCATTAAAGPRDLAFGRSRSCRSAAPAAAAIASSGGSEGEGKSGEPWSFRWASGPRVVELWMGRPTN